MVELRTFETIIMRDYRVLKATKEELLKKAGYTEQHLLFKIAEENQPQAYERGNKSAINLAKA
jgi:hypothetical protein